MRPRMEHRFEVTFTTTEAPDGRLVIALTLNQDGQAAAGEDHTFFLDVDPAIAHEAAPRLANLLTEYVTGFGVMLPIPPNSQNQSEHDVGSGGTPQAEVVAGGADTSDAREPNTEEGQPNTPPQVHDVNEAEIDEARSPDPKDQGSVRAE